MAADTGDSEGAESAPPRLFSNLNDRTLRHEPGSVLGAAALVAGTTVGAGILALPYATRVGGNPVPFLLSEMYPNQHG